VPDDLRTAFLDLLHELEYSEIDLMLGGGYGLFLKQEHLDQGNHDAHSRGELAGGARYE